MKKLQILPIVIAIFFTLQTNAQVLNVPLVVQEQNQWCWAGCSKCILDYFGDTLNQCDIAEYARTAITWTSYGSTNCCVDPNQGCNYWNYNYGYPGSIQDILIHFDNVQNNGLSFAIPIADVNTEVAAGRPFVVRWGWNTGGGHFVVGHGMNASNDMSYMNPWPGEGLHVAQYSWVVNDGVHTWTHTNVLTSSPLEIHDPIISSTAVSLFPNPAQDQFSLVLNSDFVFSNTELVLLDVAGREVSRSFIQNTNTTLDTQTLGSGLYFYQLTNAGEVCANGKLIVE